LREKLCGGLFAEKQKFFIIFVPYYRLIAKMSRRRGRIVGPSALLREVLEALVGAFAETKKVQKSGRSNNTMCLSGDIPLSA
jgi:hypothetical protein